MKPLFSNPSLEMGQEIASVLLEAGAQLVHEAAEAAKRRMAVRRKGGVTLRPGKGTPLWNAVAAELRKELRGYGRQARLARGMGVSRQTINAWVTGGSRMPDAERTLELIAWLVAVRRGQEAV